MIDSRSSRLFLTSAVAVSLVVCWTGAARASDHADTQILVSAGRHDGRITDLFAFTRGDNLVLILCLNPTVPAQTFVYDFATDLTVKIAIDNNSLVTFSDVDDLNKYGGTVANPAGILEDIILEITFDSQNQPTVVTMGLPPGAEDDIEVFTGLRDDPFIRGPVTGKNVAAIVLEFPLEHVLAGQDTLLIWGTSAIDGMAGDFQEMVGRSLRSQLSENLFMNSLHPSEHEAHLGVPPDVMIYDTSRPASFPNGRELTDDVIDLVGDPRLLTTDGCPGTAPPTCVPSPSANDRPFEAEFPYLAQPHLPPGIPTVSAWGIVVLTLTMLIIAQLYFGRRQQIA